ncbi:hypothetical protein CKAH01_01361 [Colletotrichum kahawae]|uniref:Uncharacterized protein n=1 Tax=Colletotrichum kahawae TaxID=34407 RepID=A0AAD9Y8W4_COLKA|nr:hypothetical protein CKAH01_01361 [Colletotrichum kahawae]
MSVNRIPGCRKVEIPRKLCRESSRSSMCLALVLSNHVNGRDLPYSDSRRLHSNLQALRPLPHLYMKDQHPQVRTDDAGARLEAPFLEYITKSRSDATPYIAVLPDRGARRGRSRLIEPMDHAASKWPCNTAGKAVENRRRDRFELWLPPHRPITSINSSKTPFWGRKKKWPLLFATVPIAAPMGRL